MNINNIYINDNVIYKIYKNLELNDKITFTYINKFTYDNYIDINKKLIYCYLNNYKIFYKLLNYYKYNYNELVYIFIKCINNINYVSEYSINCNINYNYIDLRFFFELIILNKELIKDIRIYSKLNNVLKLLLTEIKKSCYLSRSETIWKIQSKPHLRSLNSCFKPLINNWNYLIY